MHPAQKCESAIHLVRASIFTASYLNVGYSRPLIFSLPATICLLEAVMFSTWQAQWKIWSRSRKRMGFRLAPDPHGDGLAKWRAQPSRRAEI